MSTTRLILSAIRRSCASTVTFSCRSGCGPPVTPCSGRLNGCTGRRIRKIWRPSNVAPAFSGVAISRITSRPNNIFCIRTTTSPTSRMSPTVVHHRSSGRWPGRAPTNLGHWVSIGRRDTKPHRTGQDRKRRAPGSQSNSTPLQHLLRAIRIRITTK